MEKELDNAGPNPSPTSLTTLANPCSASGHAFNPSVPPAITVVKTVVTPTAAAGAATFFKRLVHLPCLLNFMFIIAYGFSFVVLQRT